MAEQRPAEEWTIGRLLMVTSGFLKDKGSATARLDSELLLAQVLKMSKVQLYVNFERIMSPDELGEFRELVRRRAKNEPVAYILGRKYFYNLELKTTSDALIPRPETEHLIDAALRLSKSLWPDQNLAIADIGCGSGAISLALAKNLNEAQIEAVDVSPQALTLAQENAETLGFASQISFHLGNLLTPLSEKRFHLICANLPYIPSDEMAGLMPDVGLHEPHLALDGGPEGLDLIFKLLEAAPICLRPDGRILLEIWPDSLKHLLEKAAELDFIQEDEAIRDLAGQPRIVTLKFAS